MRTRHLLKRLRASQLPREFIYFDCETLPEAVSLVETRLKFRLAVACHVVYRGTTKIDSEWYENFTDPFSFWQWADKRTHEKNALYIIAHNAEFDFRVSKGFTSLVKLGWEIRRFFLDGNKFTVWWQKGSKSIIVLDSMQLLPSSLAMLGEMIGTEKDTMPDFSEPDHVWFEYCRRDVDVLRQAMGKYREFISVNKLGGMAKTAAGQAFRAFRHRYMTEDIEIHNDVDALKLEREGYYGGRTECFRIGKLGGEDHYILDVRSMYPYVMTEGTYPVQLIAYAEGTPVRRLKTLGKRYYVIADVDLETDEPLYPIRYNKHLTFPIGRFRTVLGGVELDHALQRGRIRRCHRSAIYFKVPLFDAYVNDLYGLRMKYQEEGNRVFVYLLKLLLNSLYGKFGQRGFVYEEIGTCSVDDCWNMEVVVNGEDERLTEFAFGGKVFIRRRTDEAYDSFPAIAGAVTTYGRMKLWQLMEKAGRENVFYIDTDSLVVNGAGYRNLKGEIDPQRLGGLHIDKIASHLVIYGLKDYAIEGRRKTRGLKSKSIKVGEHEWIEEVWERFHSALERGNLEDYRIKLRRKVLTLPYDKGTVLPDGRVIPLTLPSI